MSWSSREALEDLPEGQELVGRPSRRSGSGRRQSRKCGTGWVNLPEVRKWWETLQEVLKWSGDPPGGPELVGRPSPRSGSGREILTEMWNW